MNETTASIAVARPRVRRSLGRVLGIVPGERPLVVWVSALFFTALASASIGLNAADALFFLRFGVEELPLMILVSGVVVMPAIIAHAAGLSKWGVRTWPWQMLSLFAVWAVLERLAIGADVAGIYAVVWLSGQAILFVTLTALWDVAGDVCDTQQAKRLFPLFASASIGGAIVGNALTGPLARLLSTENLLWVQAATLAACAGAAFVVGRRFVAVRSGDRTSVVADLRAGLETTMRVPLLRLVAGVAALMSLLFFLVVFPFSEAVTDAFDSEEAIAGFLGAFSSLATAATFLVSLLVANRLFAKWGVVVTLLVVPVVYVAGFSLWLVSLSLVTASLFRGIQWVAINALGGTAFSSLFNVLTGRERSEVRDFVMAVPAQIGTILAGAVLLAGAALAGRVGNLFALALSGVLFVLVWRMRRAYGAALIEAVQRGLDDVFDARTRGLQETFLNADARSALVAGLSDSRPGRRRVAAAMLGRVGDAQAVPAVTRLLADADAAVRVAALEALQCLDPAEAAAIAPLLLADPSIRMRRRAIGIVAPDADLAPQVNAALHDRDAVVRATAAGLVGGKKGATVLSEMIECDEPDAIAAALNATSHRPELSPVDPRAFVDHSDRRVRAGAASALCGRPDFADVLRPMLDDISSLVRDAAAKALLDHREGRLVIAEVLDDGSVRATDAALNSVVRDGSADVDLLAWAEQELTRSATLHGYRIALSADAGHPTSTAQYLLRVLGDRERLTESWIIKALATGGPGSALPLVTRGVISGDRDTKSEALEALESVSDRSLATRLAAILEDAPRQASGDRRQVLEQMVHDEDPWLRALSMRVLAEDLHHELMSLREQAETDDSDVVRTGLHAVGYEELDTDLLSKEDLVLALQQVSFFAGLDPEDLESVAALAGERTYPADTLIFEYGARGDDLLLLVEGSAVVEVPDQDGYRRVTELSAGDTVGELAVLHGGRRAARVTAGDAGVRALELSGPALLSLVEDHTAAAMAMMAVLAERLVEQT